MQRTNHIGYDQVLQLVWQLSPKERRRLAKEIVFTEQAPSPSEREPLGATPRQDLTVLERRNGFALLQVPFSDTEEGRIRQKEQEQLQKGYREKHPDVLGHPKYSRETWKQILSGTPTLTSEETRDLEESMKNFRKELNDALEYRRLGHVGSD